jgi:hypothetical protein
MLGDLQEHGVGSGHGPQGASLAAGAPAGLIHMHRVLVKHPVLQLQMRAGQCV